MINARYHMMYFAYDEAGRMTSGAGANYTYDPNGLFSKIIQEPFNTLRALENALSVVSSTRASAVTPDGRDARGEDPARSYVLVDYAMWNMWSPVNHAKSAYSALEGIYGSDVEWIYTTEWTADTFIDWWNNTLPNDLDSIIIYGHGAPKSITLSTHIEESVISATHVNRLNPKTINMLVLMGCNTGHLDVDKNIASSFAEKIGRYGTVVAVDGYMGYASPPFMTWHTVVSGKTFKKEKQEGSNRHPSGVVAYGYSYKRRAGVRITAQPVAGIKGPMNADSLIKAVYEHYVKK